MTIYSEYSPYYLTPVTNNVLGTWTPRTVPSLPSDKTFVITEQYNQRPDLLAFNLYGDSRLWWVFAQRNPNTILDPIGDFISGVTIYIPDAAALKQSLGL